MYAVGNKASTERIAPQKGTEMIFTRRFGALAARPNFRETDEVVEPTADDLSAEAELEAMTADVEQESVYAAAK